MKPIGILRRPAAWLAAAVIALTILGGVLLWQRKHMPGRSATFLAGDPVSGGLLFQSKKCSDCHAVAGISPISPKGPSLAHLASRAFLGGGISRNTPENLMLWLTDPQAAKPGNRMPNTPLSAQERVALLAYLESLQ